MGYSQHDVMNTSVTPVTSQTTPLRGVSPLIHDQLQPEIISPVGHVELKLLHVQKPWQDLQLIKNVRHRYELSGIYASC